MREAELTIPHLFRCPISLDLFTDPVTLCTGQTYDRPNIQKWLSSGNSTCPVTMQNLDDTSMVPNHTLRSLIDQFLRLNHNTTPKKIDKNLALTDASIATLKHILESRQTPIRDKLQTLGRVSVLSDELPNKNSCLIQLGFFRLLLDQVLNENRTLRLFSQENVEFVEESFACALKLVPFCSLSPLNILKNEPELKYFSLLLIRGTNKIKNSICQLIETMSLSPETKDLCSILGHYETLLQGLVILIQENSLASDYGIRAIYALCSVETNRLNLVKKGVVNGLITYISSETNLVTKAMTILEMILGFESGKRALIEHPNGVKTLVKMVFRVSDHEGSEIAVDLLMALCLDSKETRERAIYAGVLSQLLLLLQSQCGGSVKIKARTLLKLLRKMWFEKEMISA